MDIKIGFTDSPREVVIKSEASQDAVLGQVNDAIRNGEATTVIEDGKGRKYLLRVDRISYVEFGASHRSQVGFAG